MEEIRYNVWFVSVGRCAKFGADELKIKPKVIDLVELRT